MTKKEQAVLDAWRRRAALTLPPFERPTPGERWMSGGQTVGWFFNLASRKVTKGWSTGTTHKRDASSGGVGSQGGGEMYSSELDAWRAMRWAATDKAMEELAEIDLLIAQFENGA